MEVSISETILLRTAIITLAIGAIILLISSLFFYALSNKYIHTSVDDIPEAHVALLLGTSKYARGGRRNLYYYSRLLAAAELYHQGKVRFILASGDNRQESYNEPQTMMETLVAYGIPPEHIYLDYAGLRTFDSVVRAGEIFGLDNYIIISQYSHLLRAIYIAHRNDQNVIGFASNMPSGIHNIRFQVRESLARIRALIDLHILNTRPHHLGKREYIPVDNVQTN